MKKTPTEQYENSADAKEQVTIQTDDSLPNKKNIPGDSVEAHKELEKANALIAGEEIKQQNENL